MVSLNEFAKRIRIHGQNIERNVGKLVREVALVADRELVLSTPVDTGRARSNWIVSLGQPVREVQDAYSPGESGSTAAANVQAALAQGQAQIAMRKDGQDIAISNNLPYIGRLNEGSSAQAPQNFVETAVQRAVAIVRNAKGLTK